MDSIGTKTLPVSFSFPLLAIPMTESQEIRSGGIWNGAPGAILNRTTVKVSNDNDKCMIGALCLGT